MKHGYSSLLMMILVCTVSGASLVTIMNDNGYSFMIYLVIIIISLYGRITRLCNSPQDIPVVQSYGMLQPTPMGWGKKWCIIQNFQDMCIFTTASRHSQPSQGVPPLTTAHGLPWPGFFTLEFVLKAAMGRSHEVMVVNDSMNEHRLHRRIIGQQQWLMSLINS